MTKNLIALAALGLSSAGVLVAGATGCGGSNQPANNGFAANTAYGTAPPGYPQTAAPGYPQTAQPYPATAYPPAATAPPAATPAPATAAPAQTGTGCDPSVAAAMQGILSPMVSQYAPGAKPEGAAVCGNLSEGQSLQTPVTLQPGGTKCYTGIGVGAPSFAQLDVALVAAPPPPLPPATVSQSNGGGAMPVMAGKPNCYKNLLPIPISANFKLTATKGSGPAMAQLYSKLAALLLIRAGV